MTGRELILYILKNNLEDKQVIENGKIVGFMTEVEAAERMNVGIATIITLADMDLIPSVKIGDCLYIPDIYEQKVCMGSVE